MTLCINPRCQSPLNSDTAHFCAHCQTPLLLKQRYRAVRILGSGGFGKTYEALDLGKPNKVIKVLINNSRKAVELFRRESEVLSQISNPGIPAVEPNSYITFSPAGSAEPIHCLVMEKIDGINLQSYIKQLGHPIDSNGARRWLSEMSEILAIIHAHGVIHRDIKPANIIIRPDGNLSLIDFGSVDRGALVTTAELHDGDSATEVATRAGSGTFVSSVGYTAPEQVNGTALPESDYYSLARTFVFLLTAREPSEFPYDVANDCLDWRSYADTLDTGLADCLDKMQSVKPSSRPKGISDPNLSTPRGGPSEPQIDRRDIELPLSISPEEAALGCTKKINIKRFIYKGGPETKRERREVAQLTVPPRTNSGDRLLLAGLGHGGLHNAPPGNAYIIVAVDGSEQAQVYTGNKLIVIRFIRGLGLSCLLIGIALVQYGFFTGDYDCRVSQQTGEFLCFDKKMGSIVGSLTSFLLFWSMTVKLWFYNLLATPIRLFLKPARRK